jgi:hypothetical protein
MKYAECVPEVLCYEILLFVIELNVYSTKVRSVNRTNPDMVLILSYWYACYPLSLNDGNPCWQISRTEGKVCESSILLWQQM